MSSLLSSVQSLLPYHLMCYGTLLGFQIYQSFINTKMCFLYLPKPQFRQLTNRIFPVYFRSQVLLALLTASTHPSRSLVSLSQDYPGLGLLSTVCAMGMLNWVVFGPRTTDVMVLRAQQEANDTHARPLTEAKSPEAKALDRRFSRNHAMAIHLNAISLLATIVYGFWFSTRLTV